MTAKKKKAKKKKARRKVPAMTEGAWELLSWLYNPPYAPRRPKGAKVYKSQVLESKKDAEFWGTPVRDPYADARLLIKRGYAVAYKEGTIKSGDKWIRFGATERGLDAVERHAEKLGVKVENIEAVALEKAKKKAKKKARGQKNPMATADELRAAIMGWVQDRRIAGPESMGFWTPDQWEERRSYPGPPLQSGFVVYAEGTPFNHALGYGDSPGAVRIYREWEELLKKNGWWWEALTVWAFHVYPADAELTDNPAKRRAPRADEIVVLVETARGTEQKVVPVVFVEDVLAVHPSMRSLHEIERGRKRQPTEWGITHAPSGQLVATVGPKDWARKLAKEIVAFSEPGLRSPDPRTAAQAMGGPGLVRAKYILHVSRQSREPKSTRGKFPTYKEWSKTAGDLHENPADLASQAAVAAAVGALVGGIVGALGGAVILGVTGAAIGAASAGTSGAATGAVVGGIYGVPLGSYIGTIWGAVRQTDRALEGYPATQARVLAGLGAALTGPFAPVGAGVGAYLGAPDK